MIRHIIILLLFIFVHTNSSSAQNNSYNNKVTKQSLNLKDLGIVNTSDATPIIVKALQKCEKEGIRKMEIPKGTYHFYPTFAPEYGEKANINETYSRNIIIRNNHIKTFDSPILLATSVDGIFFEGNTIVQTDTYKPLFPGNPNLKIVNCNPVAIGNNTYKSQSGTKGTLHIDEKSKLVNLNNNHSFDKLN